MSEQTQTSTPSAPHTKVGVWLVMLGLVTVLAGVLFGYDQGVISGALSLIKTDFHLSSTLEEVITSWVTLGALFGALVAGGLADRVGRRPTGMIAGALFVVGAIIQATAPNADILIIGRFVIGFGVGVASVAAPLYAAEMAPKESRGRFVSTYQLAITIGILIAYLVDDLLTESGEWRRMFAFAAVPGVALVLVMFVMPESPRWLMKVRRRDDARASFVKVSGEAGVDERLDAVEDELAADESLASWKELMAPNVRRAIWVGAGLALFQQITGINAIIYYADDIFKAAGFTSAKEQTTATLYAVGVVNVLATFIAIAFVDHFGRRPLLFAGLIGMVTSLSAVGLAFLFVDTNATSSGPSVVGIVTLVGLVVYIASFAFSLGPIVWTVISEIFPNRIRGKAIALATAINWGSAFLVSATFVSLSESMGQTATFWMFAVFGIIAFVWIYRSVPETKGRSLEEIQEIWDSGAPVERTLFGPSSS